MSKIRNSLVNIIRPEDISDLLQYTKTHYRPYDPGQYLYNLVTDFPDDKFSDKFIELIYTTLVSWNMNQRGAKLSDFEIFKQSILDNKQYIQKLEEYTIEKLANVNLIEQEIKSLLTNLELVAKGKPKLVTFSKTLHYFLPNLLMPIDRSYTLIFFYKNTDFKKDNISQLQIYFDIFEEFRQFASRINYEQCIDTYWNKNIPKMIDNIIIAYISKLREKKKANNMSKLIHSFPSS
jgi:hypothetical protein